MSKPTDVDSYIREAPEAAQHKLRELRQIVMRSAPEITEKISYGMPTFDFAARRVLHISAAKNHVAVYALVHVDGDIPSELSGYVDHRSTLHFRFDEPLPAEALAAAIASKVERLRG